MKISVQIDGVNAVKAALAGKAVAIRRAAAKALSYTANAVRQDVIREMEKKIAGGPTAYTKRAMKVTDATEANLEAIVELRTDSPAKGTPFDKALSHLFTGNQRAWKKMEGAFLKIRALPSGYMMVPAPNSWAIKIDSHGNPPATFIRSLIGYFNAYGEQGYRANMKDSSRRRMAKFGKTESGYKKINGVVYFISYGRTGKPGGDRFVNGRFDQHLHPGIWAKRGIHGSDVAPVFFFVKARRYAPKFDLQSIGERTVGRLWQRNLDKFFAIEMRKP